MLSRHSTFFPIIARFAYTAIFILPAVALLSCDDEVAEKPPVNLAENRYVNQWILENMQGWYLWNDELPTNVDPGLAPDEYFAELLSPEDRFSWIQPDYQELLNSLKGITKEAGFEFVLYRDGASSDKVIAQVMYVKPSSPASAAGLKRGDVISAINGKAITTSNYQNLLKELKAPHSLRYRPLVVDEERFEAEKEVSLGVVEYSENPNFYHAVIEQGDHRIGYYVYNFFATGQGDEDTQYDDQMDQIFAEFKDQNITDLVVDLRFNSGGSEHSARNLASLIGAGISSADVFFSRVYNDDLMVEIETNPELGPDFLTSEFMEKTENVGGLLQGGRVYILTSSRTASASELIINSLNPYMDVFLIGDVTYGKNVGSVSIYEENDPRNGWGLQPIVVKVANSEGFSDYGSGFVPDIENLDNGLFLYPLGDLRENLLAEAISQITGEGEGGRVRATTESRTILRHSIDDKHRGLIMSDSKFQISDSF